MSNFQAGVGDSAYAVAAYGIPSAEDNENPWFVDYTQSQDQTIEATQASLFPTSNNWSQGQLGPDINSFSDEQALAWTGELSIQADIVPSTVIEQASRFDQFDDLSLANADEAPWNASHGKGARSALSIQLGQKDAVEGGRFNTDLPTSCSNGYPMDPSSTDSGYRSVHRQGWEAKSCDLTNLRPTPSGFREHKKLKRPRSSSAAGILSSSKRKKVTPKTKLQPCPQCNKLLKNKSEEKKHEAQHKKPFHCEEHGCSRKDGFGTKNDLERHRHSVHKMLPEVGNSCGYICSLCQPPLTGDPKVWPRKDNFTSHIRRKHPEAVEEIVLENSKRSTNFPSTHSNSDYAPAPKYDPVALQENDSRQSQHLPTWMQSQISQSSHKAVFIPGKLTDGDNLAGQGTWTDQTTESLRQFGEDSHCAPASDILSRMQRPGEEARGRQINLSGFTFRGDSLITPTIPTMAPRKPEPEHSLLGAKTRADWGGAEYPDQSVAQTQSKSFDLSRKCRVENSPWVCTDCGANKTRQCDIRKHQKRHTRPYGCTFRQCFKRFGSRNDWKRHESARHFLPEMWRCEFLITGETKCGFVAYDNHVFSNHLAESHKLPMDDPEHGKKMRQMHLGRFGNINFWCGFCDKLFKQNDDEAEKRGSLYARFKHVGDHLDKGEDIGEWICVEKNKPLKSMSGFRGGTTAGIKGCDEEDEDEDSDLGDDGIGSY